MAAGEQMKITELRLAKLVGAEAAAPTAARRTGQILKHLAPPGDPPMHGRGRWMGKGVATVA